MLIDSKILHESVMKKVGKTPLDSLLSAIDFPVNASALDIGAGGFVGAHTTDYIIEHLSGRVIAVESIAERCEDLRFKYGDRVEVRHGLFQNTHFGVEDRFDLIVIEPNSVNLFEALSMWLPVRLFQLLKPGGVALFTSVTSKRLAGEEQSGIGVEFLDDFIFPIFDVFWHSDHIDDEVLRKRFSASRLIEPIGVFPRRYKQPSVYSWIMLRRRLEADSFLLEGHTF